MYSSGLFALLVCVTPLVGCVGASGSTGVPKGSSAIGGAIAPTPVRILNNFSGGTIAEVEDFLAKEKITTVADFLPRLSPEYRSNFVLMRQSASLQATDDPLNPRAILFGNDARLILAFNHTGSSVEMIERRDDHFEFERLNFSGGMPPTKQVNCVRCHDGHPLWGQYRNWAGMFGGDNELVPAGSAEEIDYISFLKRARTDGLYKNLIFKCGTQYSGGTIPGYLQRLWLGDEFPLCQEDQSLVAGAKDSEGLRRRLQQPGEALNVLFNRNNASRLFVNAKVSAAYDGLKYALSANLLGCLGSRIYDQINDEQAVADMRQVLNKDALPILSRISALAAAKGSTEISTQGQIFNLLGIDKAALRMDIRSDGRPLGNDCEKHSAYSPNPYCQPGNYGYESYNDGGDMGADLIAYLSLREIYSKESDIRERLSTGLQSVQSYFSSLPEGSGSGYLNVYYNLVSVKALIADLDQPSLTPAGIPKFIRNYPLAQLPRWGNGAAICKSLLAKASF